jgi:hypothetical protein
MPAGSSGTIRINDTLDGVSRGSERTLTFAAGDVVDISLLNVPFLLGDDRDVVGTTTNSPAALPRWFTDNQWHHFVYYAFSSFDAIGGGASCDPVVPTCLTLNVGRIDTPALPNQKIRGVAVIAGRELTGLPRGAAMSDYFESENDQGTTPNTIFTAVPLSSVFTDQVSVLGSVP